MDTNKNTSPPNEVRYCVDCRWYLGSGTNLCYWREQSTPLYKQVDLVTGQPRETRLDDCYTMRYGEIHYGGVTRAGDCGIEGKLWEPKEEEPEA